MPFEVLRHRPFALLLTGRMFFTVATNAQGVAIGWQIYTVARQSYSVEESALMVGMIGLVQFLPLMALSLLAGETADRYDRRRIMLCCSALLLKCSLALIGLSLWPALTLTPLFIVAALFGVARAFIQPASMALAPTLVPPALLPQAVAMNTLSAQAGMVLGPWLGGVLCAVSVTWAYGAAASLFFGTMLIQFGLLMMKLDGARPLHAVGSRLAQIQEGLSYVWRTKVVFGAISLDLFAVLLGGVTALLPVFAHDILHVGAEGFGLLRSAAAAGGGAVTLVMSLSPIRRHAGPWMLWAVVVYGLATLVFAVSRELWLSMAMLIVLGAADSISVFVRQSLIQIVTPNHMRGRVSAVSTLFISASNELGEFESGVAARLLGPIGAALLGGFGSIGVTGLWAWLFPALRQADKLALPDHPKGDEPALAPMAGAMPAVRSSGPS